MCVFVRSAGCTSSAPLRLSFARLTNHHPVHLSAFRAGVEVVVLVAHFLWEVKELRALRCSLGVPLQLRGLPLRLFATAFGMNRILPHKVCIWKMWGFPGRLSLIQINIPARG